MTSTSPQPPDLSQLSISPQQSRLHDHAQAAFDFEALQRQQQQQQMPQPQAPLPAMDPAMMGYAPYQQQYYYADPNGYPAYMDMSQQMMPYEMYPAPDQRTSQPVIYY